MNIVSLVGRLTKAPELLPIPNSENLISTFTLAVDRDYLSKERRNQLKSEGKATADFIKIEVIGKQAEACANYLSKGIQVSVVGRLRAFVNTKEVDGVKYVYNNQVVRAMSVRFLEWKKDGIHQGFNIEDDIITPIDDGDIPF